MFFLSKKEASNSSLCLYDRKNPPQNTSLGGELEKHVVKEIWLPGYFLFLVFSDSDRQKVSFN